MDDGKLEQLFQRAATSAPPASFDASDVARQSRRVTARRRIAWSGASVVAAAVLVGGIGVGTGMFDEPAGNLASAPDTSETSEPSERDAGTKAIPKSDGPSVLSEPGDRSCPPPDVELAKALADQLPGTTPAPATAAGCATGVRSASFVVHDGDTTGKVSVLLQPAGSGPPQRSGPGEVHRPDGTEEVTREARSGQLLTVLSDPDEDSAPPHGPRLTSIADALAPAF